MTSARRLLSSCSNSTRGVISGGQTGAPGSSVTTIEYVTIPTRGNAVDFGDFNTARDDHGGTSSPTRGVFFGGQQTGGSNLSSMEYIEITTGGTAVNFGTLDAGVRNFRPAGTSNAHGGLG